MPKPRTHAGVLETGNDGELIAEFLNDLEIGREFVIAASLFREKLPG